MGKVMSGGGTGTMVEGSLCSSERAFSAERLGWRHSSPRQRQLGLNDVKRCCTSERVIRFARSVAEGERREQTVLLCFAAPSQHRLGIRRQP